MQMNIAFTGGIGSHCSICGYEGSKGSQGNRGFFWESETTDALSYALYPEVLGLALSAC